VIIIFLKTKVTVQKGKLLGKLIVVNNESYFLMLIVNFSQNIYQTVCIQTGREIDASGMRLWRRKKNGEWWQKTYQR
jgi:hypothetical protein